MSKIQLLLRFLFLALCYIPLGLLMFIGKPKRLSGMLYDIENFFGLFNFCNAILIFGFLIIGIETVRFLAKKQKKQYRSNIFLILFFAVVAYFSIQNDIFYKAQEAIPTLVENATLLVATEGSIYNVNLDQGKIAWEFHSPNDAEGNRNSFALDGQRLFMPFESGGIKSFDVSTGNIIWEKQIYGQKDDGLDPNVDDLPYTPDRTPLFMSQPLVDQENVVIASHGQPTTTTPYLFSFDKSTGKKLWQDPLKTHFNIFAPLKFKGNDFDYYFVNSAVYLEKHGANTGISYAYRMPEEKEKFEKPLYNQMQSDGRNVFLGDESGQFYCLPLDKDGIVSENNISVFKWIYKDDTYNYLSNEITYLEDNVLYAELNKGQRDQSALIAINAENGSLKWRKVITGDVGHWALIGGKIIGHTENKIFTIETSGENLIEIPVTNKPLSNIEQVDETHLIYLSSQGVAILNLETTNVELVLSKTFNDNNYNTVQVKYIPKIPKK